MADPVCPRLAIELRSGLPPRRSPTRAGGTYIVMEGPQFSTRAESNLYRSWGCDVIGMTNMPEAKLAREAEICYATVAMVTDFDCWHADHAEVDVAAVIKVLHANVDKAHRLIERLARDFPRQHPACPIGSDRALDVAIITAAGRPRSRIAEKARRRGGTGARRQVMTGAASGRSAPPMPCSRSAATRRRWR